MSGGNGPAETHFQNGASVTAGFVHGVLGGPYRAQAVDGSVQQGGYRAGLKEGRWQTIARDGALVREEYAHGELVQPSKASGQGVAPASFEPSP